MSEQALVLRVLPELGHINLRGRSGDSAFVAAVEKQLGQPLPTAANTFSSGEHRVFWLGPDEWLLATEAGSTTALAGHLEAALAGRHTAVNDVSGGNIAMELAGATARQVLARGCTLDLHPRVFAVGQCAQSGLAKATVLLALTGDEPVFHLVARSSYADYLQQWLLHAGENHGIEFA